MSAENSGDVDALEAFESLEEAHESSPENVIPEGDMHSASSVSNSMATFPPSTPSANPGSVHGFGSIQPQLT